MIEAHRLSLSFSLSCLGTITAFFLLAGLATGSALAYGIVPLTNLARFTPCVNNTLSFACGSANNVTLL